MYPNGLESLTQRECHQINVPTAGHFAGLIGGLTKITLKLHILYRKHDKHIKTTYYNEAKHKY